MKEIIFITKQGVKLKRKDNQIIAVLNEEIIARFPINRIKKVFILGNIEITMPAVNFLLSNNIEVYLLTNTGKFKGIITNTKLESNYNLRLKQYQLFIDDGKNLQGAKYFVLKKIENIEKFIQYNLDELKNALILSNSYNEILGIEGTASSIFFSAFKERLNDKNLGFNKREYRPANDPVNALLSFSYSLFYSLLFSILQAKGFDVYIGYLHKKRGTHAVLVSDFIEIFRVDISNFVLLIFNNKILTKDDFDRTSNGVYLKQESLKKFLEVFKGNFIDNKKYLIQADKEISDFSEFLDKNTK